MFGMLRKVFSLSAPNSHYPNGWQARYRTLDLPTAMGVNNVMPDAQLVTLHGIEGNGTIWNKQLPIGQPLMGPQQTFAVPAVADMLGQLDLSTELTDPNGTNSLPPTQRFD